MKCVNNNSQFIMMLPLLTNVNQLNFADINADGLKDLIFSNTEEEVIWTLENMSSPGLIMYDTIEAIETDIKPLGLACLNLDEDEIPELVSLSSGNDQVYIYYSEVSGEGVNMEETGGTYFSSSDNYTTGKAPSKILVQDLNGDDPR